MERPARERLWSRRGRFLEPLTRRVPPLGSPRVLLLAPLLALLAVQTGCKEDQPPADLTHPERPFLQEAEFGGEPTLAARQDQVVVYDLEPGASQALTENVSRHELEAGDYTFCLEQDAYLARLLVMDADGHSAVDLDGSSPCISAHLDAGTYHLRLFHRGTALAGAHRLAFLHRREPSMTLLGDAGVPQIGWWAMAPNDPTGKLRPGRLRALPPPRAIGDNSNFYQAAEPIVVDFTSQQIDENALFNFTNLGGGGIFNQTVPLLRSGLYPLDLTVFDQDIPSSTWIADTKLEANKFIEFALRIVDLGNQKVQFQQQPSFGYPYTNFFIDVDDTVKWDNKPQNLPDLTAQVLFRTSFASDPDWSQNLPGEGEVAVYEGCNYTGRVTIFALDTPDLSVLSSPGVPLTGAIAAVKSGHNTVAVLHSEASYGGTTVTLADSPCLDGTSIGRNTRSLERRPALPVFIASSSCEGCDLSGLDLTGVSVSGAHLQGANLSGTTLNRTILRGASLTGATFDAAKIACSDFSGTEGALVDLTQTDFFTSEFNPDISSCRSNFSNTKVDVAHLNPVALGLLDLTHATITLSPTPPTVDLSRASWKRATVVSGSLQGAHLENAALDGAMLRGIDLRGSMLSGASLNGADLTGGHIDGATLVASHFRGAILIDVTGFSSVVSVGTDFTGAHFGGNGLVHAVLEEVTLDGATFQAGTDLSGSRFNKSSVQTVDLSGLALFGANFSQANLTSSSLAGAHLSNNPDAGIPDPADFTGAHLKDVNLSGAQLQGTVFHFASFYGSFNAANGPPAFPCKTNTAADCPSTKTGFTCSCATAVGASMTRTDFSNAFLYGVEFSGSTTTINGVDFSNAILVGANFDQAMFVVDPQQGGAEPKFPGAFLQGTNLGSASFDSTSLLNAYLDFQPGGNQMQVLLGPSYTGFAGWEAPNQPVCVQLDYTHFVTQVPLTTSNTTCPDGLQHGGGCGPTPPRPGNMFWSSSIPIGQASPAGYYVNNATYTDADQSGTCNGNSANFDW